MRQPWIVCSAFLFAFFAGGRLTDSQTPTAAAQSRTAYNLNISVDEVGLTFHAADARGVPINDLQLNEVSLLDNGRPPRKILALQSLQDLPVRAGILMDTSQSMLGNRSGDRAIAIRCAQQLLRQESDQAFVINFDVVSKVVQPWTRDAAALEAGIRNRTISGDGRSRIAGTAIFDALYGACLNEFGRIDHAASGNFILLFSDGDDNASRAPLSLAVDTCQHANTAIYAFRADPQSNLASTGAATLVELTAETGGRVFHDDDSEAGISNDLRTIDANLRNQYRLVYRPPELKSDGSFHSVALKASGRVGSIIIRSGYYAPTH
jgi:Ca-activated chloride channel homolog